MTVYVEHQNGRWLVRVGRGRGSIIKARHSTKRQALRDGRELARDRGDELQQEMQAGYWQTVRTYG